MMRQKTKKGLIIKMIKALICLVIMIVSSIGFIYYSNWICFDGFKTHYLNVPYSEFGPKVHIDVVFEIECKYRLKPGQEPSFIISQKDNYMDTILPEYGDLLGKSRIKLLDKYDAIFVMEGTLSHAYYTLYGYSYGLHLGDYIETHKPKDKDKCHIYFIKKNEKLYFHPV